ITIALGTNFLDPLWLLNRHTRIFLCNVHRPRKPSIAAEFRRIAGTPRPASVHRGSYRAETSPDCRNRQSESAQPARSQALFSLQSPEAETTAWGSARTLPSLLD